MCGILGFTHRSDLTEDTLRPFAMALADLIRHRGPDHGDCYVGDDVVLAMRRLAIIDLSNGSQPMIAEDGQTVIVYNGETYNFQELRNDLQGRGHTFRTQSDTEVVLEAYRAYGIECLQRMNGMFGLAVYDKAKRQLVLARDRLGIKPLYYHADSQRCVFGSELKTVVELLPDCDIDPLARMEYLRYLYIPAPRTIYKGIHKLPPGHYLVYDLDAGTHRLERYWDVQFEAADRSFDAWSEELLATLEDAVRVRMIADVPLGAFLSGGVDSSSITALARRQVGDRLKTFSIAFDEARWDESEYAQAVVDHLDTEHHKKVVQADAVGLLPTLVDHFDEPFGDSSALPTYLLSRMTREHVTVALSGDGGDELFAGYMWIRNQNQQNSRFGWLPKTGPLHDWDRNTSTLARAGRLVNDLLSEPHVAFLRKQTCFTGQMLERLNATPDGVPSDYVDPLVLELQRGGADFDNAMLYQNMMTYLPEDILTKVDRMSMAASLEVRVPLLDHRVVELAARIPFGYKLTADGHTKHILRETMRPFLPARIFEPRKQGFSIPIQEWFRGAMYDHARERLLDRGFLDHSGFASGYISDMLERHRQGSNDSGYQIWALLVYGIWYDRRLKGRPALPEFTALSRQLMGT